MRAQHSSLLDSLTMKLASWTVVAGLFWATLVPAGSARAGRVLLLDASEVPGAAADLLEEVARSLRAEGVSALGPAAVAALQPVTVPAVDLAPIERQLQAAQAHYNGFDGEAALASLAGASAEIAALETGEVGPLLVRAHWLFAQLAILGGDDALGAAHLKLAVQASPTWQPPEGYLTPELEQVLEEERQRITATGATLSVSSLPSGCAVWLDGIPVTGRVDQAVVPGKHLLRVERSGFMTVRRWVDIRAGSSFLAVTPVEPVWDDATRAAVRAATGGTPDDSIMTVLTVFGRRTNADTVVVGFVDAGASLTPISCAVVLRRGAASWEEPARGYSCAELAIALGSRKAGVTGANPAATRPLFTLRVGGGGRISGKQNSLIAQSGGLAVEGGVGVALGGKLAIRLTAGLDVFGPAGVTVTVLDEALAGRQKCGMFRLGAFAGPRIPLGPNTLWIAGGGGVAFSWISTELPLREPIPDAPTGGWGGAAVGLDMPVGSGGLTVGPSLSYVVAGSALDTVVPGSADTQHITSETFQAVEGGLRLTFP